MDATWYLLELAQLQGELGVPQILTDNSLLFCAACEALRYGWISGIERTGFVVVNDITAAGKDFLDALESCAEIQITEAGADFLLGAEKWAVVEIMLDNASEQFIRTFACESVPSPGDAALEPGENEIVSVDAVYGADQHSGRRGLPLPLTITSFTTASLYQMHYPIVE